MSPWFSSLNKSSPTPSLYSSINTLSPIQNGRYFPDAIFICIFLNENVIISNKISLKFVPKGSINNIPTLVQIIAWRRPGKKPLSESMTVRLSTHICVTRPQRVKLITSLSYHSTVLTVTWQLRPISIRICRFFEGSRTIYSHQGPLSLTQFNFNG